MTAILKRFFGNTELVLIIAIILPFLVAFDASTFKLWINILLGIVMFFSMQPFFSHRPEITRRELPIVYSLLINYVLLSGAYVLLAYLFFGVAHPFFIGFVLVAIVPPAVSIVPMCFLSRCDYRTADASLFVAYALSLIIMPVALYLVFAQSIHFSTIVETLAILIIIPAALAFVFRQQSRIFASSGKIIINICLALVIFLSISLNRSTFFSFSKELLFVYLAAAIAIVGIGLGAYAFTRTRCPEDESIDYALYGSQKNVGTAIVFALMLFNPLVAVPAIVALVFQFIFFLAFEKWLQCKQTTKP